jgi:hypothetical protein
MKPSSQAQKYMGVALFLLVAHGCSTSQPAVPTSPTSATATADGSILKATVPVPQSPVGDARLTDAPFTLVATPAVGLFREQSFLYRFELRDAEGTLVLESGSLNEPIWAFTAELGIDARYTWRTRAELGEVVGSWSSAGSFLTPATPPSPCAHLNDPVGILGCWRDVVFDDAVGEGELYEFLRNAAREFNRAGVPDGPFGILRKVAGNNCEGYSCDIICAGQGDDQLQWDVLVDEQFVVWGSPIPEIRSDVCEIQFPD